jgi:hypothetical protein
MGAPIVKYSKAGVKPYFMFPTCKGEKFRNFFGVR